MNNGEERKWSVGQVVVGFVIYKKKGVCVCVCMCDRETEILVVDKEGWKKERKSSRDCCRTQKTFCSRNIFILWLEC